MKCWITCARCARPGKGRSHVHEEHEQLAVSAVIVTEEPSSHAKYASTISKVLNGRADVAAATRARVEHALAERGYRRRGNGRSESRAELIELVFHELDPLLFTVTSKTFIGSVYSALGLENIADAADAAGSGYPQLSAEYVVAANPDVVVLADSVCCGQRPSTVASRPGWDRISAVRTGSIVRVHDSIASRWGPRLVDFFRAMSSALERLYRR